MQVIKSPAALKSSFRLEVLEPFGLKIQGNGNSPITSIDPAFLDKLLIGEKLVLMRGFLPFDRDLFLSYCGNYPKRKVLEWDFGPVMEMKESADPKNYLFSREKVPFHWDGAFYTVPTYLVFHCIQPPLKGAGGETLFCDTEKVWLSLDAPEQNLWDKVRLTYETAKLAHYGGSFTTPLVQRHPETGRTILRFAEEVTTKLNPVSLKVEGLPETAIPGFLGRIKEQIYSREACYTHQWEPNDFLLADNHALVHGRKEFEKDCPRHLRRIQLI